MKFASFGMLSIVGAAVLLFGITPAAAQVSLGSANSFAALGGSTVTNTGASAITGDVGVFPGSSVTGFPPGVVAGGTIHAADAVAGQAQADLTAAYNAAAGTACNTDLTGQDLGGLTLAPGVYCFTSSAFLTGTLTLDFQGNPNAFFLFKIGSTLTTASGSSVVLINNGGSTCPSNLFWQVGSSAVLNTGTIFAGNILALTSISLATGARISGRALARNGGVTLDTNMIARCGFAGACPIINVNPESLPNGIVGTNYNQMVSGSGGVAPYSFSVSSGALPNGLVLNTTTGVITGSPLTAGTSNFTITAVDFNGCLGSRAYIISIAAVGCPVITLGPPALPSGIPGMPYSQTLTVSGGVGPYTFGIRSGALPTGLTLNPTTGVISGTPTASGFFTFTLSVSDGNSCPGASGGMSITIEVAPALIIPALDWFGLGMLMLVLAGAGLLVWNRRT